MQLLIGLFFASFAYSAFGADFYCNELINGNHQIPLNSCAPKYITCNYGRFWLQPCAADLYYDGSTGQCKKKEDIPACCKSDFYLPTFSKDYFNCKRKEDGNYADTSYKCAPHFFQCVHGEAWLKYCPYGLYFDPNSKNCLRAKQIDNCDEIEGCN